MSSWSPATFEEVKALLVQAEQELHPAHRAQFTKMQVPFYKVPLSAHPGESVVVVAEYKGKVLYWSDIEEGWELDTPKEDGSIRDRGSSQFELGHLMWQLFGDPEKITIR